MTFHEKAQLQQESALPEQRLMWGIAVSDMANRINPAYTIPAQVGTLAALLSHKQLGMELQFEGHDTVIVPDSDQLAFLGVHQPIQGIDLADAHVQAASFDRICQTMQHAHENRADYMVLHLQTRDVWTNMVARRKRIAQCKRWFAKCVEVYKREHYDFWLLAENLEYPKYPATYQEILDMVEDIRVLRALLNVRIGFALDVAHLWHSGFLIAENLSKHAVARDSDAWTARAIDFGTYLRQTLEAAGDTLELVHMTSGQDHETHLLPGATVGSHTFDIERAYASNEIDIQSVVEVLARVAAQRDRALFVVNEAIGYPYEQMIANCENLARIANRHAGGQHEHSSKRQ